MSMDRADTEARDERWGWFSTNVAANLGQFVLNLVVGLWFIPYLVRHLGAAAYGLIPLTFQVTAYLRVVTDAAAAVVGRFLTIALERRDDSRANVIFNTSLGGNLLFVALCLPGALWVTTRADRIFNVPAGLESQSRVLFACIVVTFFVLTVSNSFQVSSYCRNRFDLRNLVMAAGTATRVVTIVTLFSLTAPRLWHAGAGALALSAVTLIGAVLVWRYLTPALRVDLRRFDAGMLRQLCTMGGWIVVSQVGTLLFLNVELLVVNRLYGAESSGHYALALQWSTMLRALGAALASVFAPTVVALYARDRMDDLVGYVQRAVKLVGLVLALPVGLVCGLGGPLLEVWLGEEYVFLAPLMALLTVHLAVNLSFMPVHAVSVATNRVRWPGLAAVALGISNLALALTLAGPVGWKMYGVAAAGTVMLTIKNVLVTPLYNAHVVGRRPGTFLGSLPRTVVAVAALVGVGLLMSHTLQLESWLRLGSSAAALSCLYGALVWFVWLDDDERQLVRTRILRRRPVE